MAQVSATMDQVRSCADTAETHGTQSTAIPAFIALGCNRTPHAADWSTWTVAEVVRATGEKVAVHSTELFAFAGANLVALADPQSGSILGTLRGHVGAVNVVRWLGARSHLHEACIELAEQCSRDEPPLLAGGRPCTLVTGGAAGDLIVWSIDSVSLFGTPVAVLFDATSSVTTLAVLDGSLPLPSPAPTSAERHGLGFDMLVSAHSSGAVKVWRRAWNQPEAGPTHTPTPSARRRKRWRHKSAKDAHPLAAVGAGGWQCVQELPADPRALVQTAALHYSDGVLLLALAGVDTRVHLLVYCWTSGKFLRATALAGHEDWVRDLDFMTHGDTVRLASAAQDNRVRVWTVQAVQEEKKSGKEEKEYGESDAVQNKPISTAMGQRGLCLTLPVGCARDSSSTVQLSVCLESVLVGHEDWVLTARWRPPRFRLCVAEAGTWRVEEERRVELLTASADKTMMVWAPHEDGLWLNTLSLGGVPHPQALGFFGACFGPDGQLLLAHGYLGSFHLWKAPSQPEEAWEPVSTIGGHFQPVKALSWDSAGRYLLSASQDQTTRLFARVSMMPEDSEEALGVSCSCCHYIELARPQVHGYDLNALCAVPPQPLPSSSNAICPFQHSVGGSHRFASGADEKVVRVFDAPSSFLAQLHTVTDLDQEKEDEEIARPPKAELPQLGLTNRAQAPEELKAQHTLTAGSVGQIVSHTPRAGLSAVRPLEEDLFHETLWPEVEKLYGHGYELMALASNPDGTLLASACVARQSQHQHAAILLWDTRTWRVVCTLPAHSLTVVALAFSPDGHFLASASRDRHFALFEAAKPGEEPCFRLRSFAKAHARIVWGVAWAPDSAFFATASRDRIVKIWGVARGVEVQLLHALPSFNAAITAVAFAPQDSTATRYVLATGLETGALELWSTERPLTPKSEWSCLLRFPDALCHEGAVCALAWRWEGAKDARQLDLASAGMDHTVRIFHVLL